MTGQDQQTYRRGAAAALIGLVAQVAITITTALAGLWSESPALYAATWYSFGGWLVWGSLWAIYRQHQQERAEALEAERLSAGGGVGGAMFGGGGDELGAAKGRLEKMYRWGMPVVGLALAGYWGLLGGLMFYRGWQRVGSASWVAEALGERARPGALMAVMIATAFGAFIVARYEAGMTRVREWRLLRAGAGVLMGNAVICLLMFGAAGCSQLLMSDVPAAWMGLVAPGVMAVLGVEIVVVWLTGLYRPRKPEEMPRAVFDSRVMGWLTSPESLAKAVTQTINYQFGFEVTGTWFYQMLSRSVGPLLGFGVVVLVVASCVVVVGPGEEGLVTRFGAISGAPVGPGVHMKWFWPVGRMDVYPVGRVHQVTVGSYVTQSDPGVAILWTNQHAQGKEEYLVTAPTVLGGGVGHGEEGDGRGKKAAPGMSLAAAQISLQYRITDLKKYVSAAEDPAGLIGAVADREVNAYFVTKDIDTLIGRGRMVAGEELAGRIQERLGKADLGVAVVFVGVLGIHPPQASEVAGAFHEQVGADQEKQTTIQRARQEAIQSLAGVAGSVEGAGRIREEIRVLEALRRELDEQKKTEAAGKAEEVRGRVVEQELKLEAMLGAAPGKACELISGSRVYRWERATGLKARAASFEAELAASRMAPQYYRMRAYYNVLGESLGGARKYVIASKQTAPGVFRLDLKDAQSSLEGFLQP